MRFPLEGAFEYPEVLAGLVARSELVATIGAAHRIYADSNVSLCYYLFIPSVFLCVCPAVAGCICCLEKRRDARVRAFLEAENKSTFESRGLRFDLLVSDGIWVTLESCFARSSIDGRP
jgi:hypothetical protein